MMICWSYKIGEVGLGRELEDEEKDERGSRIWIEWLVVRRLCDCEMN